MSVEPTLEDDFIFREPFSLESGESLLRVRLHYAVYGQLNERRDNVVLVYHALTGSARIGEWWSDVIGGNKALDTDRFCFVCANNLGSCYGSTGADEIRTLVTTRDIVRTNIELLNHLGVEKCIAVIGGSVGGMLALQTAADFPERVKHVIAIGAAPLSSMGLALNHLQRAAIRQTGDVALARQIATITYKSTEPFDDRFGRKPNRNGENPHNSLNEKFDIAGYLDYQAAKFVQRFDVGSYNLLSKAMDLFDLSEDQMRQIKAKVSLVGISSDWLFPASDIRKLTEKMRSSGVSANYVEMFSRDGHDAFLSDTAKMSEILSSLLNVDKAYRAQLP